MNAAIRPLIDLAHAAFFGQASWQMFIDRVVEVAGADCATLFFHDAPSGRGAITLSSGVPDTALRDYADHFGALNPWMWQVGQTPICEAVVGEQLVPRDRMRSTEYYNDFLQAYGQETGVGVTIERASGRFLMLSTLSGDLDEERNLNRARVLTEGRQAAQAGNWSIVIRRVRMEGPSLKG